MSATESPPMRRMFDAGWGELVADVWGEDGAAPVLLLHGGGQTRGAWGAAGARLAALGRQAIAADARGHGESSWSPDGVYSFDNLAGDVRLLCRELDRPPVIVGASMGGLMSLIAAGEPPRVRVERLILVDVAHRPAALGVSRIVGFMRSRPDGFDSLDEVSEAVAAYLDHRGTPPEIGGLRRNLRERDGRLVWHWDPRLLDGFGSAVDTPALRSRIVAAARALAPPPVLIRGGASDVVTPAIADEFRRLVPGAISIDVADAGHMVAGDRNDRFVAALERALAS